MGSHLLGPAPVSGHPCSYQRSRVTRLVCGITEGGLEGGSAPCPVHWWQGNTEIPPHSPRGVQGYLKRGLPVALLGSADGCPEPDL